jgi:hypothetical protein
MAYIGPEPAESFTSFATQEFSTSATTSYTLDHAVANENELALFVNNVRQQPGSGKAYTATGTALTLSAATASTDTMYCVFLGRALQTVTPATNSITAAMVGNDLISGKDALASAPADTDEFLVSDAGTLKRIDYSLIKSVNTPIVGVRKSSNQTLSDNTQTKITFDTEDIDTDSAFASDKFTVPSGEGGKYLITSQYYGFGNNNDEKEFEIAIYKNGASVVRNYIHHEGQGSGSSGATSPSITAILDLSASDYIEIYASINVNSGTPAVYGNSGTNNNYTNLHIAKLIG